MAELHLSLDDCQTLLLRLRRLNKEKKVFFAIPSREDEVVQLTPAAHIIADVLIDVFKLNNIGVHIYMGQSSQKRINLLIESLTEIFAH